MTLVLTNDDGIDALGIAALEEAARAHGPTLVVAPATPQSGVGHQVTTHAPIHVREDAPGRFRVSGTPGDCTRLALKALSERTSWVLAGINHGGNLGADAYMSGTVAAAREAALHGVPAIALSQYIGLDREIDWGLSARRAARVLAMLLARPALERAFWSVNLPHPESDLVDLEIVFCDLDPSPHAFEFVRDGETFSLQSDYHRRPRVPGRDVDVCMSGRIAVTRIPLDLAGYSGVRGSRADSGDGPV